uniref:Pentatricopeptide repeat-containing protein n=1 Tax=Kalanchoe fedtschenkoi TaxID=63787 RepID=A0A7N0UV09_KALFE
MARNQLGTLLLAPLFLPNSLFFAKLFDSCLISKSLASMLASPSPECPIRTLLFAMLSNVLSPKQPSSRKLDMPLPDSDKCSWNLMISGSAQNGFHQEWGFIQEEVTLASVISAYASLSAINKALQIHARAFRVDKYHDGLVWASELVHMYSKCGRIEESRWIFDIMSIKSVSQEPPFGKWCAKEENVKDARMVFMKMTERNLVSWNAVIAGHTQKGDAGMVEEGRYYFYSMDKDYSLVPSKDHYTCMVRRNIEFSEYVAEKSLQVEPRNSGPYVLLSNRYAELGRWTYVGKLGS